MTANQLTFRDKTTKTSQLGLNIKVSYPVPVKIVMFSFPLDQERSKSWALQRDSHAFNYRRKHAKNSVHVQTSVLSVCTDLKYKFIL